MKAFIKAVLHALPVAVLLAGCGGGYDPGPVPEPRSPVISDPGTLSVTEYASVVTKLSVSSPDGLAVTLSLSGDDAGMFTIGNDGTLRFALPPDYATPVDANQDNVYQVKVTANDTYSTPSERDLAVTVTPCPSCAVSTASAHVSTDDTTFVRDNIIASFEYPALMQKQTDKFTLTGAFANTTNWNNLEYNNAGLAPAAARIGNASVSTCEIGGAGCDAPTGSIIINDITVTSNSITFLMSGGNGSSPVGVQVIHAATGQVIGNYTPDSCGDPVLKGDQHYVHFDTHNLIGEKIQLRIYDEASGGCGFVAFDHFYQTDQPRGTLAGVLQKP
jgi:hypothetical protein